MYYHAHLLATEKQAYIYHCLGGQTPKAVAIADRKSQSHPRHHVSTFEYQVAVAVHCQHTVKGHPYGSSGKPWDDWPFPTCLKSLALS